MPRHEQRKINTIGYHLIGIHRLFHQCMWHGVDIQVHSILVRGLVMILGWYVMTINILLILYQGVMIYMIGHHGRIKIFINEIGSDVQKMK